MKITFIVPTLNLSGGLRVVAIYAELFTQMGHKVIVVSPGPAKPTLKQRVKSFLAWKGYQYDSKFNDTYFKNVNFEVRVLDQNKVVEENDIDDGDIVISTFWNTAEWMSSISDKKGKKVYFVQHDETHNKVLPKERILDTYRQCFNYVTIAKWLVELLEKEHAREHVHLVPNSVDFTLFSYKPREKQRTPTIGFLYSETKSKGLSTTLKVISKLKNSFPELKVKCFGAFKTLAIELPDYIEMKIAPEQDQIREIYAECDVWLCCSITEGFGLPILEAMACGTPVVSTRSGGPDDIVKPGRNGYLSAVGNVEELYSHSRNIIELDDHSWSQLSVSTYTSIKNYTWNDAALRFEAVLKTILSQ
jgi:glycosyltransferase involved in cell wall biosynthesis